VEHLLRQYAEAHEVNPKRLSRDANAWLLCHAWSRNVCELSHLMERATLLCAETTLDPHTLEPLWLPYPSAQADPLPVDDGWDRLDEPARIRQALMRTQANMVGAARLLGMSRSALRYRLQRHGIGRPDAHLLLHSHLSPRWGASVMEVMRLARSHGVVGQNRLPLPGRSLDRDGRESGVSHVWIAAVQEHAFTTRYGRVSPGWCGRHGRAPRSASITSARSDTSAVMTTARALQHYFYHTTVPLT
jgi:hypothetical protein